MNMNSPRQFRDVRTFWRQVPAAPLFLRGANITAAGRHNRKVILHAIRAGGDRTCGELAELTGLTPPAVFKIARGLVEEGLVTKSRVLEKALGQPSHALKLNPDAAFALGLNVDRDHLTLVVVNFSGQVVRRFHKPIPFCGPEAVRAFVADSIAVLTGENPVHVSRIAGFGIAIPDDLGATVLPDQPAGYRAWNETDLSHLLSGIVDAPLVRENDAAAAAIGEMLFGAGLELDSFFYLFVGAGLGGGLVIDKQYVRGAHGRSGEIGFLPQINPLRSSRTNLQKTLGDAVLTAELIATLHGNGYETATVETLDDLDQAGQALVDRWIEAVADYLYLPLLNVLCIVDPDAILIGGRLPAGVVDRLCHQVNMRLSMHVGIHWPRMAARPASCLTDSAAVGAAILAFQGIWDVP